MEKIVLIGGGGHCKSVIDVIRSNGKFEIFGILDSKLSKTSKVLDVPVIGDDSLINSLQKEGCSFHITVGQIHSNLSRRSIAKSLLDSKANIPNVISGNANISSYSYLGEGITLMHNVTLQADTKIDDFTIINDHALIEHDVQIGKFCHITTGAIINGNVTIGDDVFIGSGAIIVQGTKIPSGSFIKAGQLVK